ERKAVRAARGARHRTARPRRRGDQGARAARRPLPGGSLGHRGHRVPGDRAGDGAQSRLLHDRDRRGTVRAQSRRGPRRPAGGERRHAHVLPPALLRERVLSPPADGGRGPPSRRASRGVARPLPAALRGARRGGRRPDRAVPPGDQGRRAGDPGGGEEHPPVSDLQGPAGRSPVLVSVIIPVYFNEENIPVTWAALESTLRRLPPDHGWEVLFVDDGSGDRSYERLLEVLRAAPDRVSVVKLTRNFGQVAAILAGLRQGRGDCCVVMSADLQDPPELILQVVERWDAGPRKIVLATRTAREDGLLARWASRTFYRSMRRFAIPNMPEGGFDFFLVDRRVVDLVNATEERNTFLQGQILWTGFVPEVIPYTRR